MRKLILWTLAAAALAAPAYAADMPAKAIATPVPFVIGYSGNGWYKGVGTFIETNNAQVSDANVTTAGGALNGIIGYQWANATRSTFGALQGSFAYHNVGGSNLAGAVTSRWSGEIMAKFGGPITNVLQWLPAGASFPTLPAIGAAVGSAHPWIGGGVRFQDARGIVTDIAIPASKHNISAKGFLAAGIMQQYCTTPTSCLTMDTFFEFNPSQDGFNVTGESQAKLGKGYRAGMNFYF
jgi:opacity protein-like surface antigen